MLRIILLLATIICGPVAIAENTTNCGSLYGDWNVDDYRDSKFWNQAPGERTHLYLVEAYHFNNAKEMMAKNQNLTSQQARVIWKDLDYTLRHIPNHHLALHYVFDLERRNGGVLNDGNPSGKAGFVPSSYCYFNRATRLNSKDDVIYLVYGIHLHKLKDYTKAYEMYKKSESLNPNSIELAYNIGLLLADQGNYQEAKKYAESVYERGYQFNGLKNRLKKAGYWPNNS